MEWHQFFRNVDVLLTPVVSTVAIPHDHTNINSRTITVNGEARDYWDQTVWTGMASAFYLPATVIPVGTTDDGLPVGIQIMGPYLEDRTPIDFAGRLSELIGGFKPPPKL
jgi:amidase